MAGDGVACRRCCGIPNGVARLDEALRTNGYSYNTTIGSDGGLPDKRVATSRLAVAAAKTA